jgi:hypothetical protein
MKNIIKYIFFSFVLISQNGYSQACGGGKLTFNIYILNGSEIQNFEYEIFPVSKKLLQEKFYKKVINEGNLDNPNYNLFQNINNSGIIIMKHFANEIIEANNDKLNESLNKLLHLSNIARSGKIKSSLSFTTLELNNFPIILKISNDKQTIYILGNYFGGCNREASLVWDNEQSKLN